MDFMAKRETIEGRPAIRAEFDVTSTPATPEVQIDTHRPRAAYKMRCSFARMSLRTPPADE
jgi:hypothetical protein